MGSNMAAVRNTSGKSANHNVGSMMAPTASTMHMATMPVRTGDGAPTHASPSVMSRANTTPNAGSPVAMTPWPRWKLTT